MKKYQKPQVIAKNTPQGAYAAGCPAKNQSMDYQCKACERSK